MPSAEPVHQQPLLWGAKTRWLLLGVSISTGARRKALVQLGRVAFHTVIGARRGRLFPPCYQPRSPSVLGTRVRADVPPMAGQGHGEDGSRGSGWEYAWHRLVPVAELLQLSCRRPSALGTLAESLHGSAAAEMSQKSTGSPTCTSFFCGRPFLPRARNGVSCEPSS